MADAINIGNLKFNKFLRKEIVEKAVLALKFVIVIVTILVVIGFTTLFLRDWSSIAADITDVEKILDQYNLEKEPTSSVAPIPNIEPILSRNIFGNLAPKAGSSSQTANSAKPVNKTPLVLVGTFVFDNPSNAPYAIIEDDKKKIQDAFGLNEMVFNEAKLISIQADKVIIERGGEKETLLLDDSPGGAAASSSNIENISEMTVNEAELDQALQNLPLLLTQARAVPYFKNGKSVGLRLFAIKAGSLYEKIGLQNGDILKTVNDNSLADLSQAAKLFEDLKQQRSISVVIERNREEREFRYQIR